MQCYCYRMVDSFLMMSTYFFVHSILSMKPLLFEAMTLFLLPRKSFTFDGRFPRHYWKAQVHLFSSSLIRLDLYKRYILYISLTSVQRNIEHQWQSVFREIYWKVDRINYHCIKSRACIFHHAIDLLCMLFWKAFSTTWKALKDIGFFLLFHA